MSEQETKPASVYVAVTIDGTAFTLGTCRALNAEVAGRVNLTQSDGTVQENYPLTAGYNPVKCIAVDAPSSGDAATGVWALYE